MISRLSTRAPFPKPQPFQSRTNHFIPLSWFILWTIDRPIYLISLLLKINPKVSLSNILNWQYFYSKNFLKNEEKGKLYDQVNLEPLLPLLFTCLTKVRMFLETVKLLENLFWKNNTTNNSKDPLLLIGQVYSVIVSKNKTIIIVWFSKIGRTFQFVKSFLKKNREPWFYD